MLLALGWPSPAPTLPTPNEYNTAKPNHAINTQERGVVVDALPEGIWKRVADGLDISPEELAAISDAMATFARAMARLMAQREAAKRELAAAMTALQGAQPTAATAATGARAGSIAAVEEAMAELTANLVRVQQGFKKQAMRVRLARRAPPASQSAFNTLTTAHTLAHTYKHTLTPTTHQTQRTQTQRTQTHTQTREHRARVTLSWSLKLLIREEELANAALLAWPFMPRFAQIAAAKLGWDGLAAAAAAGNGGAGAAVAAGGAAEGRGADGGGPQFGGGRGRCA